MRKGDGVLFYHSNADPLAVVGYSEIVKEAYPDHTQFELITNILIRPQIKKTQDGIWLILSSRRNL